MQEDLALAKARHLPVPQRQHLHQRNQAESRGHEERTYLDLAKEGAVLGVVKDGLMVNKVLQQSMDISGSALLAQLRNADSHGHNLLDSDPPSLENAARILIRDA